LLSEGEPDSKLAAEPGAPENNAVYAESVGVPETALASTVMKTFLAHERGAQKAM